MNFTVPIIFSIVLEFILGLFLGLYWGFSLADSDDSKGNKEITNADHIRASTNEELAEWLNFLFPMLSYEWLLDWLEQEVKDE